MEVPKPKPIEGKFTQLPRKPVCLDEGKADYTVVELEQAVICHRADADRVRENYRLYQSAVKAREK